MWMDTLAEVALREDGWNMRIKGVSMEITSDRREWKKKTCCADPTLWDKGTMMMTLLTVHP
jgi:hypothetical protein